jgi:hypothetical protein
MGTDSPEKTKKPGLRQVSFFNVAHKIGANPRK